MNSCRPAGFVPYSGAPMPRLGKGSGFRSVLLAAALFLFACNRSHPPEVHVFSKDGSREILVPKGWSETTRLHDRSDLQVAAPEEELYVFVLSEKKDALRDMTLRKYADLTREGFTKTLVSAEVDGPIEAVVQSQTALQSIIRGSTQGLDLVYIHTVIESKQSFHQVMAWTLKSSFPKKEKTLRAVIETFHETGK